LPFGKKKGTDYMGGYGLRLKRRTKSDRSVPERLDQKRLKSWGGDIGKEKDDVTEGVVGCPGTDSQSRGRDEDRKIYST